MPGIRGLQQYGIKPKRGISARLDSPKQSSEVKHSFYERTKKKATVYLTAFIFPPYL